MMSVVHWANHWVVLLEWSSAASLELMLVEPKAYLMAD